jgi:MFS family permease
VLLEWWSWRSVFGLNVLLAVIAIVATLRVVPESADPDAPKLDVTGALIAVVGLAALVYAIIEAPTEGWGSARTLTLLAIGAVVLAGFVGWELRVANPLLDPRLFKLGPFAAGTTSLTLQFFAFFGFIFLLLQYLQLVLDDSPLIAALSLIPMAFGMMPAARVIAPRLVERVGTRITCSIGLVLAAGSFAWLSRLDADSSYWWLVAGLIPLGAGMGLAMTPATTAVTDALPADKQGVGSAVNDLSRELGGALGIAVLGSVLQSIYRSHLSLGGVPSGLADRARESLALALHAGGDVATRAQGSFVDGMQAALLTGAGAVLGAAVAVAVLSRTRRENA